MTADTSRHAPNWRKNRISDTLAPWRSASLIAVFISAKITTDSNRIPMAGRMRSEGIACTYANRACDPTRNIGHPDESQDPGYHARPRWFRILTFVKMTAVGAVGWGDEAPCSR
ncbi:hypothetical protein [Sphingomonas aerolata]|uniref:hypothetical protein n=1 Tax=Sphingomonas aerolata TaxID=185951 RepID=UPI002FE15834